MKRGTSNFVQIDSTLMLLGTSACVIDNPRRGSDLGHVT